MGSPLASNLMAIFFCFHFLLSVSFSLSSGHLTQGVLTRWWLPGYQLNEAACHSLGVLQQPVFLPFLSVSRLERFRPFDFEAAVPSIALPTSLSLSLYIYIYIERERERLRVGQYSDGTFFCPAYSEYFRALQNKVIVNVVENYP
ncbi:hypothetical protein CPSG_04977 [Coccidioides posadasii str. Silveira]|uniref:Secreted protein n=1 Tax=Coccidioides posadasii (strain RMSCC 757 / Silveira) TaxID=443226 RepID=E9D5U7_COCPS|nr:hypothetical protein CPSG_04977 [Coccidioides posadasii str. Silveira]